MRRFVLASNNEKKLKELRDILSDAGIEVISQREAGCDFEVDESGETFEENARLKAVAVTRATRLPAVADDSGLVVDALGGAPGVHSARYGGDRGASDESRYSLLLKNLEGSSNRSARFVSCICCTFPDGGIIETRGECEGEITMRPRGEAGFGYDPVFVPLGGERTFAEMTDKEKGMISHRGKALAKFKEKLREYYAADR